MDVNQEGNFSAERRQRMDVNQEGNFTAERRQRMDVNQDNAHANYDNLIEDNDTHFQATMDENVHETEGEQEMADEYDNSSHAIEDFNNKVEHDKILERRFYSRSFICGVLEDYGEDILKPFKEGKNRVVIEEVPSALHTCSDLARIASTRLDEQIAVNWSEASRTLTIGPISDTERMEYVMELLSLAGSGNSDLIRKKMIKNCLMILRELIRPAPLSEAELQNTLVEVVARGNLPFFNEARLENALLEVAARGNMCKGSRERVAASYERGVQTMAAWDCGDVNVSFIDVGHCEGNTESLRDVVTSWFLQVPTAFDPPISQELCKLDFDTEEMYDGDLPLAFLHVEMAVIEGIVRHGDKSLQCLGMSRPCCYLCYQVIRILNEHHGYNIRIKECGMELDGFWKIPDLPPDIKTDILHRLNRALCRAISDALLLK